MQERNGDERQGERGKDEPLAAFADFSQTHTLQTQSSSQAPMSLLDSCSDNDSDFDKLIAEIADAQDQLQLQLLLNTTPNPKEGGGGGDDETTSASFLMLDTATPTPTDVISCAAIGAGILPSNSSSNSSSTPQPLKSEEKTQGRKVGCGRGKQGVHELSNSSPRAAKKA
jgi:hypothetical protein